MIVAHIDACVQTRRVDRDRDRRCWPIRRVELDVGVPLAEEAVCAEEARIGDEIDLAVILVDDVRLNVDERTGGQQHWEQDRANEDACILDHVGPREIKRSCETSNNTVVR